MTAFDNMLSKVALQSNRRHERQPGDYIEGGLLYCGQCRTPKQTVISLFGKEQTVGCLCVCAEERLQKERERQKAEEKRQKIERLRINGIQDKSLRGCTFEKSTEDSDALQKCRRYVKHFSEMRQDNTGLLLWGNTGNGKTYAAACIANALLSRGVPVLLTSFPKLLAAVTGLFGEARVQYLESLNHFPLLILDDFGAERQSEFAQETVYSVIDERYKSGLPMILTTNLSLSELKAPKDMTYQRIYDRILSVCVPLHFAGESLRKKEAARKLRVSRARLGSDD